MKVLIFLFLVISTAVNALPYLYGISPQHIPNTNIIALISPSLASLNPQYGRLYDIKNMLKKETPLLRPAVINKVLASLTCAQVYHIDYNPILTIIDYSMPSNQKRMWVFDLVNMKMLYNTYVSHGITSGTYYTVYFSNRNNSKASSLGVYLTGPAYYGREGLSLRLKGIDKGFNHNAMRRYIVMHGGWYMDEKFIKKYGRPGRSWGCPSVPMHERKAIIDTIKNDTFMVIYYPSDDWFIQSKFLNCQLPPRLKVPDNQEAVIQLPRHQMDDRAPILFSDLNRNDHREQNEPIIVMKADDYTKTFNSKAPLKRMLRRRIDNKEYIALSPNELNLYIAKEAAQEPDLSDIMFVVPKVIKRRGVWRTLMKVVHKDKIIEIKRLPDISTDNYLIQFDKKTDLTFKPTHRFIRWLGL